MPGGAAGTGTGISGGSKAAAILMVCFAAFGGILFGYDTGTISGIIAMPYWLQTFGTYTTDAATCTGAGETAPCYVLLTHDKSLVVSILSAGTFTGALLAYPVGDLLGRKWGLIASTMIVFNLGVILQAASSSLPLFIVGRVIAGMGVGLVSCLVPMYQSEVSPRWIRGFVVGCYQWAITIGLLIAACANQGTQNRNDSGAYRIPICIQFAWALILSGGLLTLPESPRFLIKKGRDAAARHSLGKLLKVPEDDPAVEQEFQDIYSNLQAELAIGATSYLDCFKMGKGKNLLRVQTGIWLQAMQQLTGINFIFYYGTTFFKQSGIDDPFLITIATNVVNVGMTVPGILCIDRLGRRFMLFWGAVGMCVCEYLIAIVFVASTSESAKKVLIAFTCIYIAFFASTWGPIAWVVTGEIFPLAIRAKAMSMSTASNWLWNFGIGYATPYLVDSGDGNADLQGKVFFVWGSTCLLCIIFTYFLIPETKGLSLEQVDLLYQNSTILGAGKYRQQLLAESRSRRPSAADIGAGKTFAPTGQAGYKQDEVYNEKASEEGISQV